MRKKITLSAFAFLLSSLGLLAQDTTVVQTLDYNSGTRDTVITFPDGTESYRQILMLYNMRCKGARVSTGANRNLGCGEWDYSCNTYITDPNKRDSFLTSTKEFTVSNVSSGSFSYTSTPVVDKHETKDYQVNISSQSNTQNFDLGTSGNPQNLFEKEDAKFYIIYTAAELVAQGMTAGEIDALSFYTNNAAVVASLRVSIGQTAVVDFNQGIPNVSFTHVAQQQIGMSAGYVNIPFIKPYIWDGSSNLILEVSHTGALSQIQGDLYPSGIPQYSYSNNNSSAHFDGETYFDANYKGVLGQDERSADVWIKTTTTNGEICSWGTDRGGEKWVFRINESGAIRVEVNGGNIYGTTVVNDGKWHHVAYTFSGTDVSGIKLYVDGVLEINGALANRSINTTAGNDMRISRGVNNRYFTGEMNTLRVWNKALSVTELNSIKDMTLPSSSALQSYLVAKYFYDGGINDGSINGLDLNLYGNSNFISSIGRNIRNGFLSSLSKPIIRFTRADVNQTVDSSSVFYSNVTRPAKKLKQFKVVPRPMGIITDSLDIIKDIKVWGVGYAYTYDVFGNKIDSIEIPSMETLDLSKTLPYYRRQASSLEIMSFVTPYGIGVDFGVEGKTWVFDVTDFAPILKGDRRMFMSRGGQFQEEMDIKFLFIKGEKEREVLDINEIWPASFVTANYAQIQANTNYFPPVKLPVDKNRNYVLKSAITGHGQQGEFIPREHSMIVDGKLFTREVWKECSNNPVYPQGGTWIYDRAGWCPGMPTDVARYDITNLVNNQDTMEIDYTILGGSGDSRYIISNQLVEYGPWKNQTDAAMSNIVAPSNRVEYERLNPMCVNPRVEFRNTGADTLTFVKIKYWVNTESNAKTDVWHGSVAPGEYVQHTLPVEQSIWTSASGSNNQFFAKIEEVNGKVDPNDANNLAYSSFELPGMVPDHIVVFMRSNNAGSETSVKIVDDWGQVKYERKSLANSTLYRDTVRLGSGCHKMIISDNDGDGINFWANNDGAGFIRLLKVGGGFNRTFEGDFGGELTYHFSVNNMVSVENAYDTEEIICYPNPTNNLVNLHGKDVETAQIVVYDMLGKQLILKTRSSKDVVTMNAADLPSGIYTVNILLKGKLKSIKFLKK